MHTYWDLMGRTTLAFVALLLISKLLGKQTISNLTFHDFATGITLGSIVANSAFNRHIPVMYFVVCFVILTLISYISPIKQSRSSE